MEKSCGVVLLNSNKVLLLQHVSKGRKGHWDFPKGHVDKGETEIETALRELKEETGIKHVKIIDDFRDTISYTFLRDQKRIGKEVVFFVATTIENEVNLSNEHADFKWLEYDSAMSKLTYGKARQVLQNAIKFYGNCDYSKYLLKLIKN